MADKHYVDDLYEMDCPKFVDFNVPQDMNDNADEWFSKFTISTSFVFRNYY